ncbi:LPXTG cell wall anchor domain-containing protein [Staphylococcus pseudintermedius]|uniref:LPXTG cell wall anchor domain-containing protein n=1 Tax=Staphylococcus pseudintermedius TaxID=283734 RepID=UPI0019F8F2DC|nr:LPXTG cell wall anchor domain-containing protein [Staphylococcus pseudintermedius]EGQ1748928.1 LPXTG cell wall anchor domain-containing protein [Staphylococcus pseudintermedius]EGQ3444033.1 LPXTG cell wall anchor domain-containing protein [Staphylococcus pseudintermedius]EGQ3455464.1 LPXTG cell wall anchor domain-containing protein [Staphylococcus pseudintermedius]EGQ3524464.1 LPXTG cell wall anchor domain-containing protein [Staphylococcus pseudintermedius]EGQ3862773.1 LPXTG cell wall anch
MKNKTKKPKSKFKNLNKAGQLGLATLMISLPAVTTSNAHAQPIKELKNVNVEVPTASSEASSKYAVVAGFNEKKTEVKPFGMEWGNVEDTYTISNPTEDKKGKIGILYTNVGNYEGKPLDLKITLMDWDRYINPDIKTYITFEKSEIGHSQSGYNWIDQVWEYVDHETGKPVKISGSFMTFADLDAKQYVEFSKETTDKIDKMYVSEDTWVDATQSPKGELKIGDVSSKTSNSDDKFAMVTALFDGGRMHFKWGKDYTGYPKDEANMRDGNKPLGAQFFAFSAKKPVKTELLKPAKRVSDADEKAKTENNLKVLSEKYSYEVSHTVPSEYEEFFYKSYVMSDTVPKEIVVGKVEIVDETGKNVTDKFENKSNKNELAYSAKADELKKGDFYGHTYTLKIEVNVDTKADISKLLDKDGNFIIQNTARVSKDGNTKDTNPVKTKIKKLPNEIKKYILNKDHKLVEKLDLQKDENVDYVIEHQIGNGQDIKSLKLSDDLEDVLDINKDVKVYMKEVSPAQENKETKKEAENKAVASNKVNTDNKKEDADKKKVENKAVESKKTNADNHIAPASNKEQSIVFTKGFKDITKEGTLKVDEEKEIYEWTAKDPKSLQGKEIYVEVKAKVKKDAKLDKYTAQEVASIPNIADLIINDKDLKSNKVVVNKKIEKPRPPAPKKPEPPAPKKPSIPNMIKKYILNKDHKLVEKLDLQKDENVDYVIEHQIGNEQEIKTLKLTDDLEDALDINKDVKVYMKEDSSTTENKEIKTEVGKEKAENKAVESKKTNADNQKVPASNKEQSIVFTKGFKDITKEGTLKVDEEKEIYEWTAKDPKSLQGKEIYVEVKAKVKKDAKLDKYTAQEVASIPNIADLIINDKDLKSNKVVVNKKIEKLQPPAPKKPEMPAKKLPFTGIEDTTKYTIIGFILLAVVGSAVVLKRRKEDK